MVSMDYVALNTRNQQFVPSSVEFDGNFCECRIECVILKWSCGDWGKGGNIRVNNSSIFGWLEINLASYIIAFIKSSTLDGSS